MKNLAPDITRQRLIVEGFYSTPVDRTTVNEYLTGIADHLSLRHYGEPAIFSPGGAGKDENQGFDAFLPLIDSGISLYVWHSSKFFSAILFTCKTFDSQAAVSFTRAFFKAGEIEFGEF